VVVGRPRPAILRRRGSAALTGGPGIEAVDPLPLAAELREVHRAALGPGALSDEWAAERLPRHVQRDGFVFLVARAEDGSVAGFAYGYNGARGHWWSEQVARSLSVSQRAEWLDRPHYEVAELHVLPAAQRRGIGSSLLAYLLTRQRWDRAILSTQTGSRKARDFYAKNGWHELAGVDFGPGYPPYLVLGRRISA
jgi:ribosomal protein S18 acetylase RimI-like enzyme